MKEAYKISIRIFKTNISRLFKSSPVESVMWARWCLPTFNPNCDQDRKGHLADADNSSCDTLIREYRKKKSLQKNSTIC
jgi:hypothetical protein